MKLIILGGYGTFGGRLAQLLADEPRLTLLIAGRSQEKAATFCAALPARATLVPITIDRDGDLASRLTELKPDILVDATGPFQSYGDDAYRVVEACLATGVHYLDLADGSDFVKVIDRFDAQAKERGLFILSGVSSFPVLTAAVVRHLAKDMTRVTAIKGGIAPSPYAGVGLNVIRAIAGYAGKPVALVRNGKQTVGHALTETMRYTISPPGLLPLRNIRFSLVDVPDLQLIPGDWPGLQSIWMGAGPVPEILHRCLNMLAWLVRWKWVASLLPLADLFYRAINILRWGEHRGGMFVEVQGIDAQGGTATRAWHLLAEGSDGPLIPSMAIEAIIRQMLEGKIPAVGARAATHALELADYETLFAKRTIYTGERSSIMPPDASLYQRLLGNAWHILPQELQAMHRTAAHATAQGKAVVTRGNGVLARAIAACIGFPEAGPDVPVQVTFTTKHGRETWLRHFAGRAFTSDQFEGKGRTQHLLMERFGPFTFGLALVLENGRLNLIMRNWNILGIPLPRCLAPNGAAYEYAKDGRFHFHVEIRHKLTGPIVTYDGWLEPDNAQ